MPTLIYYGENDVGLGKKGAKYLSQIPDHEIVVVPNGKHPCYLDDPVMWHKNLVSFVKKL